MMIVREDLLFSRVLYLSIKEEIEKNEINTDLLNSELSYSGSFRNYLIWRYLGPEIEDELQVIYINMYYWFYKFYSQYQKENGEDVGIEQQISELLEEITNNCQVFDWNKLQKIKDNIDGET